MPWMSRKKFDRLITIRTAAIEERLRETERKLTEAEALDRDLDRRLKQSQGEVTFASERIGETTRRVDQLSEQVTAVTQSVVHEQERRFAAIDEDLRAHAARAQADKAQLEELIEEIRRGSNQRSARVESLVTQIKNDLSSGKDETSNRVHALANELARLSIDLRADLAHAINRSRTTGPRETGATIDLADQTATAD
jgi:chromosome segregation ATPase